MKYNLGINDVISFTSEDSIDSEKDILGRIEVTKDTRNDKVYYVDVNRAELVNVTDDQIIEKYTPVRKRKLKDLSIKDPEVQID